MVMRSRLVSVRLGTLGAAVLAAALAFAPALQAQANDKMTPIATPDQPNAIEIGTAPLPDAKAVPARPGQGQRRRRRGCSRRRLPDLVDGERRLERGPRAGRARRGRLRPEVPAAPDPGGHGRL